MWFKLVLLNELQSCTCQSIYPTWYWQFTPTFVQSWNFWKKKKIWKSRNSLKIFENFLISIFLVPTLLSARTCTLRDIFLTSTPSCTCQPIDHTWQFTPTFVLSRIFLKFLDFRIFPSGTCGRSARLKESTAVNHQLITPGSNGRALPLASKISWFPYFLFPRSYQLEPEP